MTVHFSRSVRSIQADNLGPMLVGAAFFAVIMLGWMIWFFFAAIPYFESSASATYQQDGYIMADFSESAFLRLRRGQPAQFLLSTTEMNASAIPLVITDLYPETAQARLVLRAEDAESPVLPSGTMGQVKVTVEQRSPAHTVLSSAGLLRDQ